MSGIELPMVAIRAQVASAINFIVCCERLHDGSRKTIALSEVLPLNEKGDYRTQDIFVFTPVTKDEDGHILGYHAPTGIIPTFVAKARAYGFADLDESFFDPATYGVPPPPTFQVGSSYEVRWAPSLKHRETGHPDPGEYKKHWADFEERLKEEARHPKDAAPALPAPAPPPVQVQVPANLPGAKPAAKALPPSAHAKPAPRPASADTLSDEDKTPPPTRNPFVRPPEQDELSAPEDLPTHAGMPPRDEPKVEVSEDLLAEAGPPRSAPTAPPRRPAPPPSAAPARPATGPSNALRPAGVPQRKPGSPPPSPRPAVADDAEGPDGSNNGEKTQIRSPPPDRPRR
jgi:pilus assembly protein CpaF